MGTDPPGDPLGLRRIDATPAARRIAEEIGGAGIIPFARFMELALYAPEVGYYDRADAGPGPFGDYITGPELHPAFAGLLCGQFEQMWRLLGEPAEFWLIEGGPGTGLFAADLLETAEAAFPQFAAALRLALVERAPRLRARQRAVLGAWLARVRWLEPSPDSWVPVGCGCVFANELLDAFPVHRVVAQEAGLHESWVIVDEKRFREIEVPALSRPGLLTQIWGGGGKLPLHCWGEVSPQAPAWVRSAAGLIERGYMMLIDYGEPARTLYSRRHPLGTLRCYRDHVQVDDPLALPGLQDITAHVDLSAVSRAAEEAGLGLLGATSQRTLLERLGLGALEDALERNASGRVERRAHRAAFRLLATRKALGRLCTLLFSKGGVPGGLAALESSEALVPPDLPYLWQLRLDPAQLLASSAGQWG